MSISDGLYNVADLRPVSIHGVRGIGCHRLQFSLEIMVHKSPAGTAVFIGNPMCLVYGTRSQSEPPRPLGVATFETSWFTETTDYPRREHLSIYLDLSSEQLESLERLRSGGSFFFKLDFRAIVKSPQRGVSRSDEQVWFEANLSAWSKVLEQLGHFEFLLLCLELPSEKLAPDLRSALDQIRKAHNDLTAGRYDATVSRVRLAMDSLDTFLGGASSADAMHAFAANRDSREGMSKRARADLVRVAVRHYTHLAHHVAQDGYPESFSRHDAIFVLGAAAAAIWDAIGEWQLTKNAAK